jgi:lipoyl(octanoyl) transferase
VSAITLNIRYLGRNDYEPIWQRMKDYTENRTANSADEIWLLEHTPIFTQGQNGKPEHILNTGDIPVLQVDRGGQVTYHGPGQLIVYFLLDIRRLQLPIRQFVCAIEEAVIRLAADYGILAARRDKAPGVYVQGAKMASLGLRVKKGCSYHGLSFNMDMDLRPFKRINPCGLAHIQMTQWRDWAEVDDIFKMAAPLLAYIKQFCYGDKTYAESIYK